MTFLKRKVGLVQKGVRLGWLLLQDELFVACAAKPINFFTVQDQDLPAAVKEILGTTRARKGASRGPIGFHRRNQDGPDVRSRPP